MPPGSVFSARRYSACWRSRRERRGRAGGGLGGHDGPLRAGSGGPVRGTARCAESGRRAPHRATAARAASTRISSSPMPATNVVRIRGAVRAMTCAMRVVRRVVSPCPRWPPRDRRPGRGPVSYWLREPRPGRRPAAGPAEHATADVVDHRGRVHRAVDRARPDRHGPVAAGRRARGGDRRASGRAGGTAGSARRRLTHGLANGIRHFPDELERLEREGIDNLRGAHRVHARARHRVRPRGDRHARPRRPGVPGRRSSGSGSTWPPSTASELEFLDRDAVQAEVHSPLWQAGLYRPPGRDVAARPGRSSCRGLARVARRARRRGSTSARGSRSSSGGPAASCVSTAGGGDGPGGSRRRRDVGVLRLAAAAVGRCSCRSTTTCWCPSRSRPAQRASIGWARRQGLSDANNQFHYFRLTADDRILWGGYDAIHYFGSRVGPELDRRPATFDKLEAQFFRAFPQLEGLRVPVPLGRRDRHDDAVHGHVRRRRWAGG